MRQRGSCQVACIRPNFVGGRSRLDLLLPSFLLSREEKKGRFLRERRDLCQVAGDNHALEKSTRQTARLSIWSFFLIRKIEPSLSPFLSLMKEKEAKENQSIGDACQVGRVLQTRQRGSCQVACIRPKFVGGRSRLDLLLLSFLLSREEKKGRFLRERRDLCQVAGDNHALEKSTRQTSPPSAEGLSLMKEMEAKENQGGRAACQVSRIP